MNAIELLTKDHRVVDELFDQAESSGATAPAELFLEIKAELEAHAHIEESIFYPALQAEGDEELIELTSEALQEHAQMKVFLGELDAVQSDSDKFEPLLTKLIEDVRHHVEEEEGEMFPMVTDQFDDDALETLGLQMQAEKDRFQTSTESAHA
jgi:iron-sulfur cluster repair protein YtfE (RIC family)